MYRNVLLLDSSAMELNTYKRAIDMFGIAESVHTESCGTSALYYLRHMSPPPDLVIASVNYDTARFVSEYEKLLLEKNEKSSLVLLYDSGCAEMEELKHYRQLKKPLCVPELCDTDPLEELLN